MKEPQFREIPLTEIEPNKGQIEGLPANPRKVSKDALEKLQKSLQEYPEMMELREILVYPHGDKYVVIGGNTRLKACRNLGIKSVPCKIIPSDTPADKLRAYTILDNSSMGEWDWELLQADWDTDQLDDWGISIEKESQFNEQTDENGDHPQSWQSVLRKKTISHRDGKRFTTG